MNVKLAARLVVLALMVLALPMEWSLAVDVLQFHPLLGWCVPVVVEVYLAVTLEVRRDRAPAVAVFLGSLCMSTGVHLVKALGMEVPIAVRLVLLLGFLSAATLAAVRLYALATRDQGGEVETEVTGSTEKAAHAVAYVLGTPAIDQVSAVDVATPADMDTPEVPWTHDYARLWAESFRLEAGRWPTPSEMVRAGSQRDAKWCEVSMRPLKRRERVPA